jgi:inhibitor of cysteine peptidase
MCLTKHGRFLLVIIIVIGSILLGMIKWYNYPVQIDESCQGHTIELRKGQKLELTLTSNPTTGYSWQYSSPLDTGNIKEIKHYFESSSSVIGAGGEEHWVYQAIKPGSLTINLEYRRPWENAPPEKTFTINIIILPLVLFN